MPHLTKDEALAFIQAMSLLPGDKVGFKWLVEKLADLSAYVESVAGENEQLHAYLDSVDGQEGYRAYCATRPATTPEGEV